MSFKGKIYLEGESSNLALIALTSDIKREITVKFMNMVRGLKPFIKLIIVEDSGADFSFAKSWNAGLNVWMKSPTKYLAFAHDDIRFEGNSINKLVDVLEAHNDIDVVVPIIKEPGTENVSILNRIIPKDFYFYSMIGSIIPISLFPVLEYFRGIIRKKYFLEPQKEAGTNNHDLSISEGYIIRLFPLCVLKKSIVDKVGLYDENYYFGEDIDYTYRLYLANARAAVVRDSVVEHFGSYSIGKRETKTPKEKYIHLKKELNAWNMIHRKYRKEFDLLYEKAKENTLII